VLNQRVTAEIRARDDYQRELARVLVRGDDVNAWMVAQGMAWSFGWRGRPGRYAAEEREAVSRGRGVRGRADAQSPREFRAQHGPCERALPRHTE
jgi:micrococcal nuclease